jgi:hypothetical protein
MESINFFSQRNKQQIFNKKLSVSLFVGVRQTVYNLMVKHSEYHDFITDVKTELFIYQDCDKELNGKRIGQLSLWEFLKHDYPSSTLDAIEVFAVLTGNKAFVQDINNLFYNNRLPYKLENNEIKVEQQMSIPASLNANMVKLREDIEENIIKKNYQLVVDRLHTYYSYFLQTIISKLNLQCSKDQHGHLVLTSANREIAEYLFKSQLISNFEKDEIIYANGLLDKYNTVRNNASYAHPNSILSNESAEFIVKIFSATLTLLDNCLRKGGIL